MDAEAKVKAAHPEARCSMVGTLGVPYWYEIHTGPVFRREGAQRVLTGHRRIGKGGTTAEAWANAARGLAETTA